MGCTSPLRAFKTDIIMPSGKNKLLIRTLDTKHVFYNNKLYTESFLISCGSCMQCRLAKAREWANRMIMESYYHEESWFLTLTYDDDSLPKAVDIPVEIIDNDTGEIIEYNARLPTLIKRHCQLFMKNLRYYAGKPLRVYYVGEYGSKTYRPHYHFIIFGLHLNDLYNPRLSGKGHTLYKSKLLDKCWQYGFIDAAEVNWDTCCYVARYVTSKLKGDDAVYYERAGILPPFSCMSNRPGIAYDYYQEHKAEIYKYDIINLNIGNDVIKVKPPKYFDKMFALENPERFAEIQEQRRLAAESSFEFKLREKGIDTTFRNTEDIISDNAYNLALEDLIYDNLLEMYDAENNLLLSKLGYVLEREKYEKVENKK